MLFSKYILPIVSHFMAARGQNSHLSTQASMMHAVTDTVKKEISRLFLKIVFGLVATGVLIYSLIVLGQHAQYYMMLYDNGPLLSVLFFILVSALCAFILFKLFHKKEAEEDPFSSIFSSDETKFRLGKIYANFMAGLAEGLQEAPERPPQERSTRIKIDEANASVADTVH